MPRPIVIAHRGASGYEYENSRAAFRRAVILDADGVELDVHATRDGAIVVHHDPEVPGCGPIAALTLDEVRQIRIRNGETLPLLQEVLEMVGECDVWVEVKGLHSGQDEALFAVLDAGPAPHRYAVHSFDHRIVRRLGEKRPTLRRGSCSRPTSTTRSRRCKRSVRQPCGRSGSKSTRSWSIGCTRPARGSSHGP